MKHYIYASIYAVFICFALSNNIHAQGKDDTAIFSANKGPIEPTSYPAANDTIHTQVDQQAELPANFRQLLAARIKYPEEAIGAEVSGRVMLEFIVEKDGSITNVKYVGAKIGYGLEEEAVKVMKTMPKFKPAMHNGKPVRCKFKQPIRFALQ